MHAEDDRVQRNHGAREPSSAIRAVAAGETVILFTAADRILAGLRDKPRVPASDLPEALTERETEVLARSCLLGVGGTDI
jgi:DNA-binding NarL/FixJ family response regulator